MELTNVYGINGKWVDLELFTLSFSKDIIIFIKSIKIAGGEVERYKYKSATVTMVQAVGRNSYRICR